MSVSEESLATRISKTQREREILQAESERRREEQRNRELQEAQNQLAEFQKQIEELETQERELAKQQAELETQQKAEEDQRLQEEQRQKSIEAAREALRQKYEPKIAEAQQAVKLYSSVNYQRQDPNASKSAKLAGQQVKALTAEYNKESNLLEFTIKYPNASLGGSVYRSFKSSGGQANLIELYERQQSNQEAQAEAARQQSIAQAKSNAITERQKYEQRLEEIKKENEAIRQRDQELQKQMTERFGLTRATKQDPNPQPERTYGPGKEAPTIELIYEKREVTKEQLKDIESQQKTLSDQLRAAKDAKEAKNILESKRSENVGTVKEFRVKGETKSTQGIILEPTQDQKYLDQKEEIEKSKRFAERTINIGMGGDTPPSIIGNTKESSDRAISIFEMTEKQQSELSQKVRGAKSAKEAFSYISEFISKNEYVGTAQQTFKGDKLVSSSGVLIEKVLTDKIETKTIEPISEEPQQPEYRTHTTISLFEFLTIDDPLSGESKPSIPHYVFLDEEGKEIEKPPNQTLWAFAKQQLEAVPDIEKFKQTKVDVALQEQEEEYEKPQYAEFRAKEKLQPSGTTDPIINMEKDTVQAGFVGHANEISATIQNIANPNKQTEARPSLETLAFFDVIEQGKAAIFGTEAPKESEAVKMIVEKTKTQGGVEYLIGSIAGSVVAAAATVVIPPVAAAKYGKYVILPRTQREAQKIAEKIFSKEPDKAFIEARLKEQFPEMPVKVRQDTVEQIVRKQTVEEVAEPVPYNVEMINQRTALITGGTESTDQTIIVYRSGRNAVTSIYEAADEPSKLELREIIIKGVQSGEFDEGKLITSATKTKGIESQSVQIIGRDEKGNILVKGTDALKPENIETISYPITPKNLAKIQDPAIQNFLKIIGTRKDVPTSILQKYPQRVIESVANEEVKTAAGIYETQNLSRARSPKAEELEKDLMGKKLTKQPIGQKGFEYETRDLPQAGSLAEKEQRQKTRFKTDIEDINLNLPKEKDIDLGLPTPKGTVKTSTIEETPTPKPTSQKLQEIARESVQSEPKIQYGGYYTTSGIRIDVTEKPDQINLNLQDTDLGLGLEQFNLQKVRSQQKQSVSQKTDQLMQEDISLDLKQQSFLEDIAITREQIKEKQDEILRIGPRFSLVVIPDETTDQGQRFRIVEIQQEREDILQKLQIITDIEYPPPTKTTTTIPPGAGPLIFLPKGIKDKDLIEAGLKLKKFFFAWNVNTQAVGAYLSGKELRVGRTQKVIKIVERLERKENRPSYQRRVRIQESEKIAEEFRPEIKEKNPRRTKREKSFMKRSTKEMLSPRKGSRFRVRLR